MSLAWLLAFGVSAVITVAPGATSEVQARKKRRPNKKKRKKPKRDPARDIRQEQGLSEREDATFVDEISKTDDLKEDLGKQGPNLGLEELGADGKKDLAESKLDEEIELVEQLLQFETKCGEASPARFRLSDLYWEKSKRYFFKANDFETTPDRRAKYSVALKKFQNATIDSYKKILEQCPQYEETPKVLFYIGKALGELDRAKEGAAYYKQIIQDYPDSQWVANAWFGVGEFYFNKENDAAKALRAYKRAAEFSTSQVYGFAVYKQGWCYINTGDWDLALERFREVVAISNDPARKLDDKGRISLRKEGLKDYVRAYSHVGDAKKAKRTFGGIGGKRDLRMMMEQLGKWYVSQGDHHAVITVYRDLIRTFPRSTRLPIFQGRIVDAASRLGDKRATVAQAKILTRFFEDVRSRVATGDIPQDEVENVDKDLREAEDIAENTLRRLAMEYHKEAKKLRGTTQDRTYQLAHDLYSHYLAVFPEPSPNADVNYVFFMRYYFAEVLFKLEKFKEAAENFDLVVEMEPNPEDERDIKVVLRAAEESVRAWDELVTDLDRLNPPEISGTERKTIPEVKQNLINACQTYTDYVNAKRFKKYVEASVDDIVGIAYKMARIYYTYNWFDKAAPAFNSIVENHPQHEVACYSANLVLDIYNGQKNYRAMVKATGEYVQNGELSCSDEDRVKFAQIQERSTFKLIKTEYEEEKRYDTAGRAYLQFSKRFPKSEMADDAVFNAAVNFDLAGKLDLANKQREALVQRYPESDLVPETLYNIGQSYERVVDFSNAARWFEVFVERYPKDKRSRNALFNAGLYRATLGQHEKSREDRQKYIKVYDAEDEHEVAFQICESREREAEELETSKSRAAQKAWIDVHDCYFDFVKNREYVSKAPDLLCEAQFRRGEIMLNKTKYHKGYVDQTEYLMKNWPKWKAKYGLEKIPRCAESIAELKFRNLEDDMKRYKKIAIAELNPTDRGTKKFKASVAKKVAERDRLQKLYQEVVETGVAKWGLAALYRIGELYGDAANKLKSARIPKKVEGVELTGEQRDFLKNMLNQEAEPAIVEAVGAFELCVNRSNELGVYSRWSVKSLKALQSLAPQQYQPLEERLDEVKYAEELSVVSAGVVVMDGENLKRVDAVVTGGVVPEAKGSDSEKGGDGEKDGSTKSSEDQKAGAKAGKRS